MANHPNRSKVASDLRGPFTTDELTDLALDTLSPADKRWCKKWEVAYPPNQIGTCCIYVAVTMMAARGQVIQGDDLAALEAANLAFVEFEKHSPPGSGTFAFAKVTDIPTYLRTEARRIPDAKVDVRNFLLAAAQEYEAGRPDAGARFLNKISY